MITNGSRVRPLLHLHRRVTSRHAQERDFAGALPALRLDFASDVRHTHHAILKRGAVCNGNVR